MFAPPIFIPRFKSINFHQNIPKFKLILQKNAKFFCAEGSASRPPCLQLRLGVLPPTRISGHVPEAFIAVMLFCVNRFCGSLMFMVFRKRLFLGASLPTPGLEDEEPNHHVGNCKLYQDIRVKYFGITKTTVYDVVTKCNIN